MSSKLAWNYETPTGSHDPTVPPAQLPLQAARCAEWFGRRCGEASPLAFTLALQSQQKGRFAWLAALCSCISMILRIALLHFASLKLKPGAEAHARRDICMAVEIPLLAKYGYEASEESVHQHSALSGSKHACVLKSSGCLNRCILARSLR